MQQNNHRNELIIKVAGKEILLRPTFENISAMESDMGSIASLAYRFGKSVSTTGEAAKTTVAGSLPSITETTKIIFYNQAEKELTKEQVFDLCIEEGIRCCTAILPFIAKIAAGNNKAKEPTPRQKKN